MFALLVKTYKIVPNSVPHFTIAAKTELKPVTVTNHCYLNSLWTSFEALDVSLGRQLKNLCTFDLVLTVNVT